MSKLDLALLFALSDRLTRWTAFQSGSYAFSECLAAADTGKTAMNFDG